MRRGARHLDPGLGEQGTGGEHKGDVEEGVDGIGRQVPQGGGRRDVVHQATVGPHLPIVLLPSAEQLDQDIPSVPLVQQLAAQIPNVHQSQQCASSEKMPAMQPILTAQMENSTGKSWCYCPHIPLSCAKQTRYEILTCGWHSSLRSPDGVALH